MLNPLRSYKVQKLLRSIIADGDTFASVTSDIDQDAAFLRLFQKCAPYTMTSKQRMYGLYQAVQYVAKRGLEGDFIECGVWRGGSSMLAALAFEHFGSPRKSHLFDTFEGMPPPTDSDVDFTGVAAASLMAGKKKAEVTYDVTCMASLNDVKANLLREGCNLERINFVQGLVEETVTPAVCDKISILRLDTDWYESTLHELRVLYPKLVPGGVLIIDDYGHWQGARKAVDEYFEPDPIMLTRLDYTGRIAIKLGE